MTEIVDFLKKYTDGKQNTEKVEISVIQLNRVIKALEQEPCEDCISRKLLSDNICEGISCNECSFNEIDDESGCLLQKRFDELPSVQPEIIRCKECKYMIDTGDDLMCDNAKGWVVATTSDFGCVLAERRTDEGSD